MHESETRDYVHTAANEVYLKNEMKRLPFNLNANRTNDETLLYEMHRVKY